MRINIRVTGAAGLGMNSTADIIADVFAQLGYHVNTDIQYQSIIKGGLNYFDIFVSDGSKYISKYVDVLVALDARNLEVTLPFLKKDGIIIVNSKHIAKLEKQEISLEDFQLLPLEIDAKYDNTYLISLLAKLFSLDEEIIESKISKIFARKGQATVDENIAIFRKIFSEYEITVNNPFGALKSIGESRETTYGNKALTLGAIAGELEYYSAYPMTPASTILTEVIKDGTVPYLQAEDEISVAMSALGASFAGKRSMLGTSGGGFALMVESISFAQQAEIPLVMVLAQRAGPSTGTPTFFEQGDLNMALNPSFGDFEHIVMAPSSLENAYYTGAQALNLAQKYQTVVIVLIDKQFADGKATLESELVIPEVERGKLEKTPAADYKRYELTEDGISPYAVPGTQDGDFIATSYEHDEFGATTEESSMKVAMTEKRMKKLENFFQKEGIKGYEVYSSLCPSDICPRASLSGAKLNSPGSLDEGDSNKFPLVEGDLGGVKKIIITTSYTIYTAKEFIKNNPDFGLIIIHFLKPLDERLLDEIKGKDEVVFVESNYSGQLENYVVKEFGLKYIDGLKIRNLRKYDLYPFYYEDFETLLTNERKARKQKNNYVYIDAQNLYIQIQNLGWKIDYKKLYVYLTEKYKAKKIYYFIGYIPENRKLYEFLKEIGYVVVHREVVAGKGNVDAEMIYQIMKDIQDFDAATLITSDGDFSCVVQELLEQDKLGTLMVPDRKQYSYLLKKSCGERKRDKIVFMNDLEKKLRYK